MTIQDWPALLLEDWEDTYATLHLWTQIVGKVRLKLTPLVNHWWNVTLYVSVRGLTTSPMRYGDRILEIEFDFIRHELRIDCSDGATRTLELKPQSVAAFYGALMQALHELGIDVKISMMPSEVPSPYSAVREAIRFDEDQIHKSYDANCANGFWRALVCVDDVFKRFRSAFIGKVSPVHFYWGSFDLAVTRFSGRRAPSRDGADNMTAEAYSHEVISHGFWPGGNRLQASFYSYTAPEPAGLENARIRPAAAYYSHEIKEFLLSYEAVREASSPEETLMEFLQSTYDAGADLAKWDRAALERAV